ncbi:MAG TPA: tRNA lysidine(34) synthetase TilS [Anaerolinea thermolimosa]|uniref:tRNA(Ile)-lysidine synthase n=1 Tax=Anaerolinea thermolimosa TaxID=229919 RepID=A0A3D1JED5_9CHLR|nr:tRNA lysidine(34) synthetase TilS [Anaerolinea thermolimosa]GAP07658.1 tRNA(Ile)-lysidine synthetase, N-terminal domain [Anaerolinea thermolimosa]HCE16617.1 tRNA lysidine(34) synthetase TilS [Anaerolinea thermolimosa]
MLIERIKDVCLRECSLRLDRPVVVGVSGGADSLCLLDCLWKAGFQVIVAHFDHALRPESAEDARRVAEVAGQRGLPFIVERQDVAAYARDARLSVEEAARVMRYRFLFRVARQWGAQAVAVAHHADDQVETVLMHLLRGSGLEGLTGMKGSRVQEEWDEGIPLVRPLLGIWREEIETYCQEYGLEPVEDASNRDVTYFRNRLRHELIPRLQTYNPRIKEVLWRTAQVLAGEAEVIEQAVEAAWIRVACEVNVGKVALNREAFLALPVSLQRRLFRRAIAFLRPGLRDIGFELVERGVHFIAEPSRSGRFHLAQGLRLAIEGDRVFLLEGDTLPFSGAEWPQLDEGGVLVLDVPGVLELENGWRLEASWSEAGREVYRSAGRWEAYLDADRLHLPLLVHRARQGERFQPLGLGGRSQKLSDFWINVRLPRELRAGWPLVYSGEEIVWVPGYRPDHRFRVREGSQRLLYLKLSRGTG